MLHINFILSAPTICTVVGVVPAVLLIAGKAGQEHSFLLSGLVWMAKKKGKDWAFVYLQATFHAKCSSDRSQGAGWWGS